MASAWADDGGLANPWATSVAVGGLPTCNDVDESRLADLGATPPPDPIRGYFGYNRLRAAPKLLLEPV